MLHQRSSRHTYAYVLEKMRKKLSVWKANSLSFAGRITLVQSSLTSMPGYVMQTSVIPITVCEEAERICRDFIWGSSVDRRKCHLVSWEKLCKPKEVGGVGFRSMGILNQAYVMKLAWQLMNDRDKLWVRIMRAKYQCGSLLLPKVSMKVNSPSIWKSMVKIWKIVEDNTHWSVRNGQDTRFWRDRWLLGCYSLDHYLLDSIPDLEKEFKVAYYADHEGWKWNIIQQVVPEFLREKIELVQALSSEHSDFLNWIPQLDGLFSIKSAYAILTNSSQFPNPVFGKVSQWKGPARIRSHLWKLVHGCLLTNDERCRRGMAQDNLCPRCLFAPETLMHMMRDCDAVQQFWN